MHRKKIVGFVLGLGAAAGFTLTTALAASVPATYTVQQGDTLWKIAQKYQLSTKDLVAWNQIHNPAVIYPTQVLELHAPVTIYIVKSGDSLWKIAQAQHVTVQELAAWNQISNPALIYAGQQLKIQTTKQTNPAPTTKVVQSGGTGNTSPQTAVPPTQVKSQSAPTSSVQAVSGDAIVAYAKQFLGDPYQWGGESPSGFDCSGLVQTVFHHFGIQLPRVAKDQATVGKVISQSSLKPGDLVFFNTTGATFSHDGIYVGNGQFISATDHGVRISDLSNPYWSPRFTRATDPQA